MKEIVILSGKGGTGKTSFVASLAALAQDKVLADCDVDAADLHLLLVPGTRREFPFWSGVKAAIRPEQCNGCGTCAEVCQFEAVEVDGTARIDPLACEGCGVCAHFCPEGAIALEENLCGAWFISETAHGPMIHARLGIGEENSGKLVTLVKREARRLAEERGARWVLVDGPPGIGCPVIASLSGADLVLVVTEPSGAGLHDLARLLDLTDHFEIPACVCVNKWDLNADCARQIEVACAERGVPVLDRVPFDPAVVSSLVAATPIVEYDDGPTARALRRIWPKLEGLALESRRNSNESARRHET